MSVIEIILLLVLVGAALHFYFTSVSVKRHFNDDVLLNKLKQELNELVDESYSDELSLYIFVAEFLMQRDNGLVGPGKFYAIRYCNFIDQKKINNAMEKYAHFKSDTEIPLVMIDESIFRNGKEGMVITTHGVYCLRQFNSEAFLWSDINKIQLILQKRGAELVINDKIIGRFVKFNNRYSISKKEGLIMNELMQELHKRINHHPDLNKLKIKLYKLAKERHKEEYSIYSFVAAFFKKRGLAGHSKFKAIRYCNFIDQKKLNIAMEKYAHFRSDTEIPLVMIDDSLFKNGKKGMVITTYGIYCLLNQKKFNTTERYHAEEFTWSNINKIELVLKIGHAVLIINDKMIGELLIREKIGVIVNELLQELHKRINQQPELT